MTPHRGHEEARPHGRASLARHEVPARVPSMSGPPLGRNARWFRAFHTAVAVVELAGLADVWFCALARRRNRVLRLAVAVLAVEGAALVVGRGDCPLGPLQRQLGDPVPLFELVLPRRAAKAAVPVLAAGSVLGLALVALRPPRRSASV